MEIFISKLMDGDVPWIFISSWDIMGMYYMLAISYIAVVFPWPFDFDELPVKLVKWDTSTGCFPYSTIPQRRNPE